MEPQLWQWLKSRMFQLFWLRLIKNYSSHLQKAYQHHIPCLIFTGIEDKELQTKLKSENPDKRIYFW